MAIEVTKNNLLPDEHIWDGKCFECESTATATTKDLYGGFYRLGQGRFDAVAKCPVCGAVGRSMKFYPRILGA